VFEGFEVFEKVMWMGEEERGSCFFKCKKKFNY
jgi:hypothetical protein